MLVRHPHAERGNDVYETPVCAVAAVERAEQLPHRLWDPGCGPSANIVHTLRDHGHECIGSDIADYGRPDCFAQRDFLLERKAPDGCEGIVTNPPYRLAAEFIAHALELVPFVAALLRLTFLEGGTGRQRQHQLRRYVLDEVPPARVHVFAGRLPALHRVGWTGPRVSNPTCFAWFVWDATHAGPTVIDRINWKV